MNLSKNVSKPERVLSTLSGATLLASLASDSIKPRNSLTRQAGYAVSLGLLWRGLSGNCPAYSIAGVNFNRDQRKKPARKDCRSSIMINRSKDEVLKFLSGHAAIKPTDNNAAFTFRLFDMDIHLMVTTKPVHNCLFLLLILPMMGKPWLTEWQN